MQLSCSFHSKPSFSLQDASSSVPSLFCLVSHLLCLEVSDEVQGLLDLGQLGLVVGLLGFDRRLHVPDGRRGGEAMEGMNGGGRDERVSNGRNVARNPR